VLEPNFPGGPLSARETEHGCESRARKKEEEKRGMRQCLGGKKSIQPKDLTGGRRNSQYWGKELRGAGKDDGRDGGGRNNKHRELIQEKKRKSKEQYFNLSGGERARGGEGGRRVPAEKGKKTGVSKNKQRGGKNRIMRNRRRKDIK